MTTYGPIVSQYKVYQDFYSYKSGVYSHVSGAYVGDHAVLVVGWDDSVQAFIVKNSWGPTWGDHGFFKIAYSELTGSTQFGYYSEAITGAYNNMPTTVDFSASATSGKAPLKVNFFDESVGGVTSWLWDFGNGKTSTKQNPKYTYSKPGVYTVALTVADPLGQRHTQTATNYVTAYGPPKAAFTATPVTGQAPLTVNFTDASTGAVTGRVWQFGSTANPTTSTEATPTVTYSKPGKYTVKLTVTGPGGKNTKSQAAFIKVAN